MKISVSQINTYRENPWDYICSYYLGIDKPQSDAALLGSQVHEMLEKVAKRFDEHSPSVLEEIYDNLQDKESLEHAYTVAKRYLEHYSPKKGIFADLGNYPWHNTTKVLTEFKFEYKLGNHTFIGFIDLVVYNEDGSVDLYDYKTLRSKPSHDSYTYNFQGMLYMYVMAKLGYTVNSITFDCFNPTLNPHWKAYKYFRIHVRHNELAEKLYVKEFIRMADEIATNPRYINTFSTWTSETNNALWRTLCRNTGQFISEVNTELAKKGTTLDEKLELAEASGRAIPAIFKLNGEQSLVDEFETNDTVTVYRYNMNNTKAIKNQDFEAMLEDIDEHYDYIYFVNSKGSVVMNQSNEVQDTGIDLTHLDEGINYVCKGDLHG